MTKWSGVFTALVTPFQRGAIDLASFKRLLRDQMDAGVSGFVINGSTAESPTLSLDEVRTLFTVARTELGGGVPLILGTGLNSTAKTIEFSRALADLKPDAELVVVPYYNKPPQRGLVAHFSAIADATRAPVFLYNVPGRTITSLAPETVGELSRHPNIIGIKDATGDMATLNAIRAHVAGDFILLSGDDGTAPRFCLNGGHGVIAVASHLIGREMRAALDAGRGGDEVAVKAYETAYATLFKWLYIEANPIPVKCALSQAGLIAAAEMRLPLIELAPDHQKELHACLKQLGKV